ncbi:MAG: hypothetical protein ACPG8N_06175 [Rhodothermales bacterium]
MTYLRTFSGLLILLLASITLTGCDSFSSDDDEGSLVKLTGQILNQSTNNPIPNAFVVVMPQNLLFEADSSGVFDFDVRIDSTMDLQVEASADGFQSAAYPVLAFAGRTTMVPLFSLLQIAPEAATSSNASNIILVEQTATSISVRESGSEEQATLTFQLADSLGSPVELDKSLDVNFRFGAQPGGGEFISPALAQTDNNGVVSMTISAGTRAGIIQVVAEANVDGNIIRSQPVAVTVHGGLPDQAHFSLGPSLRNFPGLLQFGLANPMSVIVGDKYSNPVRLGTAVYFSSTHGVIGGSTLTDENGLGSVSLLAANPLPADGIAHVSARTADDQQNEVVATTPVVFSGTPVMSVNPSTARVNQVYTVTMTDINGNPLAPGTSFSISVTETAIQVGGTTSAFLDDTVFLGGMNYEHVVRGPGVTEFSFVISEDIDPQNPEVAVVDAIEIATSGPNGQLILVLGQSGAPFTTTDGARVRQSADGTWEVALESPVFEIR